MPGEDDREVTSEAPSRLRARRRTRFPSWIALLTLAACGGSSPVVGDPIGGGGGGGSGGGDPTPTNAVSVQDNFFSPTLISVPRGDVLVWTWNGSSEHNVTWVEPDLANSVTQSEGTHEARMPNMAGQFGYYCTIHGAPSSGMRGTVVVQ